MTHICVTGASSGIGRALALEYAGPGTHLTLWARDRERLEGTAALCESNGAVVRLVTQDIRDLSAVRQKLGDIMDEDAIDRAFLASGVITGTSPSGEPESVEDACRTLEVNLLANANMGALLMERMKRRREGHIVFIASIAGMYPLPNSPAYSASKQGVSYYARALAAEGKKAGVRVSCVYPGYVETPMGHRLQAMQPLSVTAEDLAVVIKNKLEEGKDRIIHPYAASLAVRLLGWMPKRLADGLAEKLGYTVVPDRESKD